MVFGIFKITGNHKFQSHEKDVYIIIAGALVMMSCGRRPYADFFTSRTECEVGDIIYFTNNSNGCHLF